MNDPGAALERLRFHLDHAPVAVIEWDPSGRVRRWNRGAAALFGFEEREVLGKTTFDFPFVHPDDVAEVELVVKRALRDGCSTARNRNLHKSGRVVHAEWYNSVLRGPEGEVEAFVSHVIDVTRERVAAQLLEESERRFRETFEQAAVGIAHVALDGSVLRVNAKLSAILGRSHEELKELTFQEFTHPDDLPLDLSLVREVLEGRRSSYALEKRYLLPSGDGVWAQLTVTLVRDAAGRPEYFISVVEDISRRRALEVERDALLVRAQRAREHAEEEVARRTAELSRTQERLVIAEKLAVAGQLAAGVAHEINNPLAYVVGNLGYLEEQLTSGTPDVDETLRALREARAGAERIRDIVLDLKQFSRPGGDRVGPVDVHATLEFALAMAEGELRCRALVVRELSPVPPVLGDESKLGQVLLNLLVNAAQAIPEGAAGANRVSVRTRTAADRVVIEVEDTGAGIAPEIRARIFEPFFTTKDVGVGTGLGLSVSLGTVRSMGGALEVDSTPGRGSTFRVILPTARLDVIRPTAPAPLRAAPAGNPQVLVVDDDPNVARMITRLLGRTCRVMIVESGREALHRIADGTHFDAILCDLVMPDLTGMDLHEELRHRRPELLPRFAVMTGGAFTPRSRAFLEESGCERIEKPFRPEQLRDAVARLTAAGSRASAEG